MQRQSQMVYQMLKSSAHVEDSVDANGADVAARLDERFGPGAIVAPGLKPPEGWGPSPSFRDTLFRLKVGLADSRVRLGAADHEHVENLRRFLAVRDVAQDLNRAVYGMLGAARRTIEENHEEVDAFVVAGIESPKWIQTALGS